MQGTKCKATKKMHLLCDLSTEREHNEYSAIDLKGKGNAETESSLSAESTFAPTTDTLEEKGLFFTSLLKWKTST